MKLLIDGHQDFFNVETLTVEGDTISLVSDDLLKQLGEHVPELEEFKVASDCPYDIEDLKSKGWTQDMLVSKGWLVATEPASAPIPKCPTVEPPKAEPIALGPKEFEVSGVVYEMQPVANGVPYEKFMETSGWSLELLLQHKYIVKVRDLVPEVPAVPTVVPDVPDAPVVPEVPAVPTVVPGIPAAPRNEEPKEYPFLNSEGDWEDSEGTIYDEQHHSMGKSKIPPVTTKGVFKKRRGSGVKVEAPTKPDAPTAEQILGTSPPPPPPPEVAPPAADAPLDAELESIIQNWAP